MERENNSDRTSLDLVIALGEYNHHLESIAETLKLTNEVLSDIQRTLSEGNK